MLVQSQRRSYAIPRLAVQLPVRISMPPLCAGPITMRSESTTTQSVHIWLGAHALRATPGLYTQSADDITGIDYDSSNATSVSNARGITVPPVIISKTGH